MTKEQLKQLIDVSAGRVPADTVIRNCRVVNVYTGDVEETHIALCGQWIAGLGEYEGLETVEGEGAYIIPGLIDSHIHVESSFVTPEEIGRLLVPLGTTTIMADPHEIVNVCGEAGMKYMLDAAENTALDIKYMLPSCVPSTPYEHAGASLDAQEMNRILEDDPRIWGIGEYMNFPGIVQGTEADLDKIMVARARDMVVDGHSPNLFGKDLNAYAAAGIRTDHECSTVEEMNARIQRGMYVLLREGSACHDLKPLLRGVTKENSRYCLLCSDDRQPKTILEKGHVDSHLRTCVQEGLDPITAIQMATINAAQCFGLKDRGAIAPGLRADLIMVKDLQHFCVQKVWIQGKLTAEEGRYLPEIHRVDAGAVSGNMQVKDFSEERLKMHLHSSKARVIQIREGGVLTANTVREIALTEEGDFRFWPEEDIVKIAVVERHHNTGNVAVGLLGGYGLKQGAVALSIAHDSHNIIVVGNDNREMACAVEALIAQKGGVVLVKDGAVLEQMALPIGGLMSDQTGQWVNEKLERLHKTAVEELGVSTRVEPLMTLCFMALPVIPELKITDSGLFDVTKFQFVSVEAEG